MVKRGLGRHTVRSRECHTRASAPGHVEKQNGTIKMLEKDVYTHKSISFLRMATDGGYRCPNSHLWQAQKNQEKPAALELSSQLPEHQDNVRFARR